MEKIIETRYLNILRFFYSQNILQFQYTCYSDSNACSSSLCGIAPSFRVVAVFMVEMALKKHSFNFNFNFGYRER